MKTLLLYNTLLAGVSGLALMSAGPAYAQISASSGATQEPQAVAEVVVTAQKRQENINTVGMSVQAASGEEMTKLGITDTAQLQKIVPGFSAIKTGYGTPVYTIRGVGFQDSSLASSGTVSVYTDEIPLPFAIMTTGTTLDVQRVEVLKGPQGTLFGQNATGGAINFVANQPTDTFSAGADLSYGRFNTVDLKGFVGGPITETLDFRVALGTLQSGPWQKSFTRPDSLGSKDFVNGRVSLLWKPTPGLRALLRLEGFQDRSEAQASQITVLRPLGNTPLPPAYVNYPAPPKNAQAADWSSCVRATSSLVDNCVGLRRDNNLYMASLRVDYDIGEDMTLTSLTAHERFRRFEPQDGDGVTLEDYSVLLRGKLDVTYQELRLAGQFAGQGNWIVGANYEHDSTADSFLQTVKDSSQSLIFGFLPLDSLTPSSVQKATTYAVFGAVDYPVTESITLQGGIRYTKQDRSFSGCNRDSGNGQWATIAQTLSNILTGTTGAPNLGPGSCGSLSDAPEFAAELAEGELNENNVAWRAGVNWTPASRTLLYFNVSHGYKAGSFPTLGASLNLEYDPVVQEDLLAYEGGFKASLLDRTLQLNGAAFYYDYTNKQIPGSIFTAVFGPLPALVNIPKSHVKGFELSAVWRPIEGLTIAPAVSHSKSRIEGSFVNTGPFGEVRDFGGERFPLSPEWQASLDVHYDWSLSEDVVATVGANLSYQGDTNNAFGSLEEYKIPGYTLVDLRAGVEKGPWQAQIWGRNVTDKYYWTTAYRGIDRINRFAGMPATYGVTISYRYQ